LGRPGLQEGTCEVFGSLPAHVTYAPIGFATQDLATVLRSAGYDSTKRTLFIWEGVTMYVPEAGIDATLRVVATNAAHGSRIVFDYFTERALRDRQSVLGPIAKNVAAVDEPFVFAKNTYQPRLTRLTSRASNTWPSAYSVGAV
jgi:methyltransferase (TIGR00027 family)